MGHSVRVLVWIVVAAAALEAGPAHADPVVADGLVALIGFDEGTGAHSADLTGNGHDAELLDGASWCSGCAAVSGGSQRILIASNPHIEVPTFTYDLWFEAGSTPGNGRIMGQAGEVGGAGFDVLERSQHVAVRVNNEGAVIDEPTIGSRSNDGPPDHWGTCEDAFHRNDGPEHLVITHDASARVVRIFIGLEGQPLRLSFEAIYQGGYWVDDDGIALLNLPDGDRYFTGSVFQFAYYDRVLTHEVDGDRNVIGGEVWVNHLAGSAAEMPQGPGDDDTADDDDATSDDDASGDDDTAGDDDTTASDDGSDGGEHGPEDRQGQHPLAGEADAGAGAGQGVRGEGLGRGREQGHAGEAEQGGADEEAG